MDVRDWSVRGTKLVGSECFYHLQNVLESINTL